MSEAFVKAESNGDPNGIRTRVTAVKGRCPGPLDDRVDSQTSRQYSIRSAQGKLRSEFTTDETNVTDKGKPKNPSVKSG